MQPYIYGPVYFRTLTPQSKTDAVFKGESQELQRLQEAIKQTKQWYLTLAMAVEEEQTHFHDTILFYQAILDDEEFIKSISKRIEKKHFVAEEALKDAFSEYHKKLTSANDYFQNRIFDLNDVQGQLLFHLKESDFSAKERSTPPTFPYILLVDKLSISEFAWLDFSNILAVIAHEGGYNSHAAIILQSNEIPLFIIPDVIRHVQINEQLLIDTTLKTVQINPSPRVLSKIKFNEKQTLKKQTPPLKSPLVLSNGQQIHLFPVYHQQKDLQHPILKHTEGIGLVRTEFFAFEKGDFLTELEQFQLYYEIAKSIKNGIVYFRLYDIEPDKMSTFSKPVGYGMEFLKNNDHIVLAQLRALLRVSQRMPIAISIPMVETIEDIQSIQALLATEKAKMAEDSKSDQFQYTLGVMVETVSITHRIKKMTGVDFIQIGSNDLLSRLLEIDRDSLDFQPDLFLNPLFLRMMKRIIDDSDSMNLPLFLCGEAANNPNITLLVVAMGITNLVPAIGKIADVVATLDGKKIDLLRTLMTQIISLDSVSQVQKKLRFL